MIALHPVQYLSMQDNDILKEIGVRFAQLERENEWLKKQLNISSTDRLEGDWWKEQKK